MEEQEALRQLSGAKEALGRRLNSVMEAGLEILARRRPVIPSKSSPSEALLMLCKQLIDHRGEASGLALANEIAEMYMALPEDQRIALFKGLAEDFDVNKEQVHQSAERYIADSSPENLASLSRHVEAPRQKLFRRINMAPIGTRTLVALRGHLLPMLRENPDLKSVDSDLKHLFVSWFNKGFLKLRRIDWSSPAMVLEKIIDYEAVHEIRDWDDLRNRLRKDRRCFAFFHPALENDPLVVVQIALVKDIPADLAPLLERERELVPEDSANTVVFYSISNCHRGLAGVSFGNFLIKNVVEELKHEMPSLKNFVTLSPVPGFRAWLLEADLSGLVDEELVDKVRKPMGRVVETLVYNELIKLCTHYLLKVKSGLQPLDPVARFHLGNGASLNRINGLADLSSKGMKQSGGIMVNYLYDLSKIEENHEAFYESGNIAASRSVSRILE